MPAPIPAPSPAPSPAPPAIIGRAHLAQGAPDRLVVDGEFVRLQGVKPQDVHQHDAAERFLSYITKGTNEVRCVPLANAQYECRAMGSEVRIGAGLVANGFALADPNGPPEYRNWENDARQAHRGVWGNR
jgi:endonuclease YncB( thermonuclease family)